MAGIKGKLGGRRRGRPKAQLVSSKAEDVSELEGQTDQSLELRFSTAEGVAIRLLSNSMLAEKHEIIIQPLMQALSTLLNRKTKGYGRTVLVAVEVFAEFLEYLETRERAFLCIADIDSFAGSEYSRWLQSKRSGKSNNGKVYYIVERALQLLRSNERFNSRPDIGNLEIKWPRGPRRSHGSIESLDEETYTGIIRSCQKDIDSFRSALLGNSQLEADAEIIVDSDPSLENLAWLVLIHFKGEYPLLRKGKDPDSMGSRKWACYLRNALKHHAMSVTEFRSLIETSEGKRLSSVGRMPKNIRAYGINGNHKDQGDLIRASIVKTIRALHAGWPVQWEAKDAMALFGRKSPHRRYAGHLGHALISSRSPITGVTGVSGILDSMYPQTHVIWSIFIWCRIQTGWNSETMASIDFDENSIMDCPLDPDNYALIFGIKRKPVPKQIIHRSNKSDRYGVYAVLVWLKKVTEEIRAATGSQCPWQFIRQCQHWETLGLFGSLRPRLSANMPVRSFFKRHDIYSSKGKRVEFINLNQLRTTYEDARAVKWDGNLRAISMDMSHESEETTERHYDSNIASIKRKDEAIATVQKEVIEHVRYFQGTCIEGESRSALAQALPSNSSALNRIKEKLGSEATDDEVFRIISPDADTFIAVCRNSRKPTWLGHENYVRQGEDCRYFNGCATCRQVVIFDEALPYVAARILKLDEFRLDFSAPQWESDFGDEYAGWTELLETWDNRQSVKDANDLARSGKVIIPTVFVGH